MAAVRVLVVEDEELLADSIARGLRWEGMAVDVALDGLEATEKVTVTRYDVIVLDRDLPGMHGDDVCRALLAAGRGERILMLTAARTLSDRVEGLGLGADDYLSKPFAFEELVARLRALARRAAPPQRPVLEIADLSVDPARRLAYRAGKRIALSRKEFATLEVLVAAAGAVVSAEELLDRAWDDRIDPFTNVVRMTIMKLRRKLGDPPIIETLAGEGYRIVVNDRP
jgi:DNA-binding response OmpR family regulator